MSTKHNLAYTRFVRQVRTEMIAVLATEAAASHAETLLRAAAWVQSAQQQSSFPPRNALQDGAVETYEAYKFVGNYASGSQRAYAGMVAYRFTLPADALTGPDHVVSLDIPLHVDRWLVDGVRVAAYLSDENVPTADWDRLREGDAYLSEQLKMEYTEADPPVPIRVEKTDTITIDLPESSDALKFLYVVLSLEDYKTVRGFWIEGAALTIGDQAFVTFDADVEADPEAWRGDISYTNTGNNADLAIQITGSALQNQGAAGDITRAQILADPNLQRYLWGSMLDSFDHIASYATGATGYPKIHAVAGGTDDLYALPSLISTIHTRHIRPYKDGVHTGLRFVQAGATVQAFDYAWSVPAPMETLVGRVSVYFLPGALFTSSSRIGYAAAPNYAPAATAAARRDFWLGQAESVSEWTGAAAVDHDAVCLLTTEIDREYPLNHVFPIAHDLTSDGVLVTALIISRVKAPLVNLTGGSVNEWPWVFGQIELIQ